MMAPDHFTALLKTYCYAMKASVIIWGLTPKRNRELGGSETTLHILWLAADVVYDDTHELEYCRIMGARLGLRVKEEENWHHIEPLY